MPPKAKFTRDQIAEAAFDLVRTDGISALTARALAVKLESSPRPIFTVFKGMEEVQQTVLQRAQDLYMEYVARGLDELPPYKGVGTQYILFAMREPKLFQLLFMTEREQSSTLSGAFSMAGDSYGRILISVRKCHGFDEVSAMKLYHHLWIYCHGIAALCATKLCRFTGREISIMLTEVCASLVAELEKKQTVM